MGRYAFFSPGFEYKFTFGVQPSEDIRSFGGKIHYELSEGTYLHHEWDQTDCETIEGQLKELLQWVCVDAVDFAKYQLNLQGTYSLMYDLHKLYQTDHDPELVARYSLGCLIYHQLLYAETLFAEYEG
jgi:hypothetical protein